MNKSNDFDPIWVDHTEYKIDHLKDMVLVTDINFDNGDARSISVNVRPTNHLFSRAVEVEDKRNQAALEKSGHWLRSYVHFEGNYQKVKGDSP